MNNIEPLLEGIPGVASASPDGGRQRQINIVVDPAAAQARGVTAEDIAAAVAQSNALCRRASSSPQTFDANVYTNAVPSAVAHRRRLVKVDGGKPVLIRDVARSRTAAPPPTQTVSVNGQERRVPQRAARAGRKHARDRRRGKKNVADLSDLPQGMDVKAVFDESTFVRTTYHGLKREVVQALVLIALVILVFLQSIRGTLIVAVAIPLSFAITLIVLYATGQTLNAFTLGGLDARDGPAGRRRGRRARVDPPPPARA